MRARQFPGSFIIHLHCAQQAYLKNTISSPGAKDSTLANSHISSRDNGSLPLGTPSLRTSGVRPPAIVAMLFASRAKRVLACSRRYITRQDCGSARTAFGVKPSPLLAGAAGDGGADLEPSQLGRMVGSCRVMEALSRVGAAGTVSGWEGEGMVLG